MLAIEPDRVPAGPSLTGLCIRRVEADEAIAGSLLLDAFAIEGPEAEAWLAAAPHIARLPGMQCLLAEVEGRPAAVAGLYSRARIAGSSPPPCCPSSAAAGSIRPHRRPARREALNRDP